MNSTTHKGFKIIDKILISYSGHEENIIIPEEVTRIGISAFENCKFIKSVVIPDNVGSVGDFAFINCPNLRHVTLGSPTSSEERDSTLILEKAAFKNCLLETINVYTSCIGTRGDAFGIYPFQIESETCDTKLFIHDSVNKIGARVFAFCETMNRLHLGKNLKHIGKDAFLRCMSLEKIVIPSSVELIDKSAFWGCSSVRSITIEGDDSGECKAITLGSEAFNVQHADGGNQHITNLERIDVNRDIIGRPPTINFRQINFGGMKYSPFLRYPSKYNISLVIGDGVKWIDRYMFSGIRSLTDVYIGNNMREISLSLFSNNPSLREVTLGSNLLCIKENAFQNCQSLKSLYITKELKDLYIDKLAFLDSHTHLFYEGTESEWYAQSTDCGDDDVSTMDAITNMIFNCTKEMYDEHRNV